MRKFQHAREISRCFITRAHAIFRQLFSALIRRITGVSARANYRVSTRILWYCIVKKQNNPPPPQKTYNIRTHTHTRANAYARAYAAYTLRSRESTRCGRLRLAWQYNVVAWSKTQARPKFFTATPRVAYELKKNFFNGIINKIK